MEVGVDKVVPKHHSEEGAQPEPRQLASPRLPRRAARLELRRRADGSARVRAARGAHPRSLHCLGRRLVRREQRGRLPLRRGGVLLEQGGEGLPGQQRLDEHPPRHQPFLAQRARHLHAWVDGEICAEGIEVASFEPQVELGAHEGRKLVDHLRKGEPPQARQ